MADTNTVTTPMCEIIHKSVDERFNRDTQRLNEHSGRIRTVEDAVIRLTIIMEKYEQKEAVKQESQEEKTEGESQSKSKFWDTDIKKAAIKWTAITIMFIAALLVGTNAIELFQKTIPIK